MYQSYVDNAFGVPLVVMVCVAIIYFFCDGQLRKSLLSSWWWLCPVVFGFWSLFMFGDLWGAIKTGLAAIFWVGIPGGIMLGYLDNQK